MRKEDYNILSMCLSCNGRYLYSCQSDSRINQYDTHEGKLIKEHIGLHEFEAKIGVCQVTPDEKYILTGDYNGHYSSKK